MSNKRITLSCKRKGCKVSFKQITTNQEYCSPECREIESNENEKYPEYRCGGCNKMVPLGFNPVKEYNKWASFTCPECGYKRKIKETISI